MALAACIALLVGGYLMLGGSFTTPDTANLRQAAPDMGSKTKSDRADLKKLLEDDPMTPIGPMPAKGKSPSAGEEQNLARRAAAWVGP